MKNVTLVVMAAGMGSRYGGLKQIDPVGDKGEIIIDYSVFDAIEAGFNRVIFVIKHEIEEDFKRIMQGKFEDRVRVDYAYQDINNVPQGFIVPEGRVKPWGTGHAVLACEDMIDGPFAVINADDYYGKETFTLIYNELTKEKEPSDQYDFCMVGFKIENTLTENGSVARGVCETDSEGYLTTITERTKIAKRGSEIMFTEDDGETWEPIPHGSTVSMNCWGFSIDMMRELKERFSGFLEKSKDNILKCEYFLPFVVDDLLKEGKARVKVLDTKEKWYGVTYRADKQAVCDALQAKRDAGIYPQHLY